MSAPENPPAFPVAGEEENENGVRFTYYQPGMTLRDYFAGQALAGIGTWMPADVCAVLTGDRGLKNRAEWAYRQADAMLAARSHQEQV